MPSTLQLNIAGEMRAQNRGLTAIGRGCLERQEHTELSMQRKRKIDPSGGLYVGKNPSAIGLANCQGSAPFARLPA